MVSITLPDGSVREFDEPVTGLDIAAAIGPRLAKDALAIKVGPDLKDLSTEIDGDGKADKQTVFADGLHLPMGFEFAPEGVYLSQGINLVLLRDLDGDDHADVREVVMSGFDPNKREITEHNLSRGLGDASTSAAWRFKNNNFSLIWFDVDASYDGEINARRVVNFGGAQ